MSGMLAVAVVCLLIAIGQILLNINFAIGVLVGAAIITLASRR